MFIKKNNNNGYRGNNSFGIDVKLNKIDFNALKKSPDKYLQYLEKIDPNEFTSLKACAKPTETGCICAWRTYKEGYVPPIIQKEQFKSIVTNPLSWDKDQISVSRKVNQGAVLYNFKKVIPNVAAANNHEGVLWTPKPKFFGNFLYNTKNYQLFRKRIT